MFAHASVAPGGLWRSWPVDPVVTLGVLAGAIAYGRGYRRLRHAGRASRRGRAAAFAAGLLALAVALLTPLDRAAASLFSAHMIQHLLLMVVAPPLLVVGRPVATALAGLPRPVQRATAGARAAVVATGLPRTLRHPAVAWVALTVALWAWHTPSLYAAALRHEPLHALEHASFLLTSMLAWSLALHPRARDILSALGRALFLIASAVQGGLLGAVLLFASTPLYPVHGGGPELWGLTPLEDQQLAGALMWVPPSAVYLVAAAAVLIGAFRAMDAPTGTERTEAGVMT
jgi:putative membrane protein